MPSSEMGALGDQFIIAGKEVGNGFGFAPVAFGKDGGWIVAAVLADLDGDGCQQVDSGFLIGDA